MKPLLLLLTLTATAQQPPPSLIFEVASIRLTAPDHRVNGQIKALPAGHGYMATNIPVRLMISLMYKLPMRQIQGGPDWLSTDGYDVEARADNSYSLDDLHTMYQNLLADRFQLHFHTETREGPVYALLPDASGIKIKPNTSEQTFDIPITFAPDGTAVGARVPMPYFSWWLGQQVQNDARPVLDQTGLTGFYDFKLLFLPPALQDAPRDSLAPGIADRPSLFDALRQQLGLKLVAQKGPVTYLIINKVARPSDN